MTEIDISQYRAMLLTAVRDLTESAPDEFDPAGFGLDDVRRAMIAIAGNALQNAPPEAKIPDTEAYNDLKASTSGRAVGEILRAVDGLDRPAQHRLVLNMLRVMGIAFAIVSSRWTPDVHELPPEDSARQRSLPGTALSFADLLRTRRPRPSRF